MVNRAFPDNDSGVKITQVGYGDMNDIADRNPRDIKLASGILHQLHDGLMGNEDTHNTHLTAAVIFSTRSELAIQYAHLSDVEAKASPPSVWGSGLAAGIQSVLMKMTEEECDTLTKRLADERKSND